MKLPLNLIPNSIRMAMAAAFPDATTFIVKAYPEDKMVGVTMQRQDETVLADWRHPVPNMPHGVYLSTQTLYRDLFLLGSTFVLVNGEPKYLISISPNLGADDRQYFTVCDIYKDLANERVYIVDDIKDDIQIQASILDAQALYENSTGEED